MTMNKKGKDASISSMIKSDCEQQVDMFIAEKAVKFNVDPVALMDVVYKSATSEELKAFGLIRHVEVTTPKSTSRSIGNLYNQYIVVSDFLSLDSSSTAFQKSLSLSQSFVVKVGMLANQLKSKSAW